MPSATSLTQERSIMKEMKTKIPDSLFKIWLLITSASSPDSADDLESQAPSSPKSPSGVRLNKTLLGLCFAAAIQIATQSKQAAESGINNSISLLSLGTAAIFAALLTSHCIGAKKPNASRVLEKVAFFLAATTFFFAIATPCPLGIKCAVWSLYIISLIAIVTCNFFMYSGGALTHAPQVPVVEGAAVEEVKEKGASAAGRAGGGNAAVGFVAVEVQLAEGCI
ncbi:IMAP FAMILY MEMBER 1 putative-RELATED [Salix viminalis]|uniref:IMAP FAMILY MEMBER 1 putative-RELATED n=1 Tax=Salix viminalis TaxID=40686 RepID=A0A9Q0NXA7_SALVM|nr:IMAP FAMILY MEMBER 1 putative-RELATED [Salix viminalis]